jgi:hypothetical protein
MQNLQHERSTLRRNSTRKSGLSVNTLDFISTDETCEKEWLSTSEFETKCARHATESPNSSRDLSWDTACRIDDSKQCCNCFVKQCKINQDVFLSNSDLLKSFNICSPILKEDRGFESWRDFL